MFRSILASAPRGAAMRARSLVNLSSANAPNPRMAVVQSRLMVRYKHHQAERPTPIHSLGEASEQSANSAFPWATSPPASIPPPLEGIRVLDLSRVLAGPYSTMLLADLGADVIKVENPKGGDDTRAWGPPFALADPKEVDPPPSSKAAYWSTLPPESSYFLSANRGKRSLTLDFKKPEGRAVIERLVKQADVVVENYVPGKLDQLGIGYDQMKEWNPRVIVASISGYGQTGPYSKDAGYDVIVAADAGLFHITGEKDRPGVKVGVALTDLTTGLYIHGAIMAALIGRSKAGKGVHIDASLFESQVASLANIGSNYLIAGQEASRHGTAHPSIVPYQTFDTADQPLMIGAGNDAMFRRLAKILDRSEWGEDQRFATNAARVKNRTRLIQLITERLCTKTAEEWLAPLRKATVPAAPIRTIAGTFHHPQALARGVVRRVHHPRAGWINMASPAVTYGSGKMPTTRPPPVLGQHSEEILSEAGYSDEDVAKLRDQGVVGP